MITFKIAGKEIKNRYVLAPLAGYTSFAMREMSRNYGAGLVYTEMTSSSALVYSNEKTFKMIPQVGEDSVVLQLFGGDKETIIKSIPIAEANGKYDFLDFNCGCPVKKVLKQNAGSAWLQREEELYDLAREMVKVSVKPVIFKIRLGFTNENRNYLQVAKLLENAGVQAITVHGRTKAEGFSGEVDYKAIAEIKNEIKIPVIANGNISLENIDQVMEITKADAYMIGRGSIGNPKIFEDLINHELGLPIRIATKENLIDDATLHLNLLIEEFGEDTACKLMRGFISLYLKGIKNIKPYKMELVRASSKKEYIDILEKLKKDN